MKEWTKVTLAKTIDHSLLKAIGTDRQVRELCEEARKYGFHSVCVNPFWIPLCVKELSGSEVSVCTVVGFPLGASASRIKAEEARLAVQQGADEVDMVINVGAAKSSDWKTVEEDIRGVVEASGKALVKVILETCYLTDEEKVMACEAARKAGARFVQTSSGFGTGGATPEDVLFIKKAMGDHGTQIKASGGIRSYHEAIQMLSAGADRIGASSGVAIVSELPE